LVKELAKKTKEEKKISQPVFVKKVENFDWFGASESICMHCGKTGHKGTGCPDYEVEYRACFNCGVVDHIAKDCKQPKKKAKKAKEAASDKLSDSTIDQS